MICFTGELISGGRWLQLTAAKTQNITARPTARLQNLAMMYSTRRLVGGTSPAYIGAPTECRTFRGLARESRLNLGMWSQVYVSVWVWMERRAASNDSSSRIRTTHFRVPTHCFAVSSSMLSSELPYTRPPACLPTRLIQPSCAQPPNQQQ